MKGIIFDLDGTLANTLPLCVATFQTVFLQLGGIRLDYDEVTALFGVTEEGIIKRVIGDKWRQGVRLYLEEYEKRHDQLRDLFPGIRELLDGLSEAGARLAMVTGKGRESAEISLCKFGLGDTFEIIEFGSPDKPIKPQGIKGVLDRWSLGPDDVAYVGDTPYDMEASGEVGVLGIGARWAETSTLRGLRQPHWPNVLFCERPDEVLGLVKASRLRKG